MICKTFRNLAHRTWDRMELSGRTGVVLREDGHTALNLQDLIVLHPTELQIVDFSPIVEAKRTGADWEWWFVDDDGTAIGFAVQAKRLHKGRYDVGYKPRNYAYQINTLLRYSAANGIAPLYCWYNHFDPPHPNHAAKEWGCAIADGYGVYQYHRRKQYKLADLETISTPWDVLACSFQSHGVPGVRATALKHASHLRGPRRDRPYVLPRGIDQIEPTISPRLPQRVRRLLNLGERLSEGKDLVIETQTPPKRLAVMRRRRNRR